jgi:CubicO group peptidase (beta-lactamase class C family)
MNTKLLSFLFLIALMSCKKESLPSTFDYSNNTVPLSIAYPVSNITVDGKIEDWDKNYPEYPISNVLENEIESSDDLSAVFKVGFSEKEKSVYVAVIVKDDIYVVDKNIQSLSDNQDQCLIYLDKTHSAKGSGVNVYSFNELYKEIDDASTSWDPAVKNANWDTMEVASSRNGNKTIYEAKIRFDEAITANKMIGLDFMIYDVDNPNQENDFTRVSWRKSDGKTNVPFKIGNVLLADNEIETGTIKGYLKWKTDSLGLPINKIKISSDLHPSYWIRADVDTTGFYQESLPKGTYNIVPEWGIYNAEDGLYKINKNPLTVEVVPNELIQVSDLQIEVAKSLDLIPDKGILLSDITNKYKKIDDFINSYMDFYEIPGVSLAIIENGKVSYSNTYGVVNTYTKKPVTSKTIFEAASITKPVFAFAVMRLVEKGIIDLDKPLYQYLPFDEIAYDERYKMITGRMVLSHKTGFPNWRSGEMKLLFEPGTEFGYSGEGFEYLKRVVEHITSRDIVDILNEEVLVPLELKNMYFEKSDHLFKVVAHGHDDNYPHKVSLPNKAGMAWSMHTEANSFSDFIIALLNRKGLQKKTYNDFFYKHTVTDKYEDKNSEDWKSYFGLGVQIEKTPFGYTFGHGGNNGDFKCEFKVYEDLQKGFIIFTNGNTGGELAYKALEQFLITGKFK